MVAKRVETTQAPTLLALETSTVACSIALSVRGESSMKIIASRRAAQPAGAADDRCAAATRTMSKNDLSTRSRSAVARVRSPACASPRHRAGHQSRTIHSGHSGFVVGGVRADRAHCASAMCSACLQRSGRAPTRSTTRRIARAGARAVLRDEERLRPRSERALPAGVDSIVLGGR